MVEATLDDDDDQTPLVDDEEEKGALPSLKIMIMILVPLILIGGGVGAYLSGALDGLLGKEKKMESHSEMASDDGHGSGKSKSYGDESNLHAAFLEIPNMIVNLSSDDGQPRYLRLSVQLELESEEEKVKVEQVMPRVVDQFQTYLRELRVSDLRGSAGIYRLQMELLARVNAAAAPIVVQDVLFQEILIQ